MPWVKFYAASEDLRDLLDFVFEQTDCQVFETYSEYDHEIREFESVSAIAAAFPLGLDPRGTGTAQMFSVWWPSVMPRPEFVRIALKVRGHRFRYTVQGCGLFSLHLGGVGGTAISTSSLGFFTEKGARAKCSVSPGPDEVIWAEHKALAGKLSHYIRQRAKVCNRGVVPVHRGAAELLEHGYSAGP